MLCFWGIDLIRKSLTIFVILMTLFACNFHEPTEIPVNLSGEPLVGATIELFVGTMPKVKRQTYKTSEKGTVIISRPASTTVFNGEIIAPDDIRKAALDLSMSWIATETTSPLTLRDLEKVGLRFIRSLPIEVESGATTTTLRWNHPKGFTSTIHLSCTERVHTGDKEMVTEEIFTIPIVLRVLKDETFTAEGSTTLVHEDFPRNIINVYIVQKNSQGDVVRAGTKEIVIPTRE